jgi:hypothetical protein
MVSLRRYWAYLLLFAGLIHEMFDTSGAGSSLAFRSGPCFCPDERYSIAQRIQFHHDFTVVFNNDQSTVAIIKHWDTLPFNIQHRPRL